MELGLRFGTWNVCTMLQAGKMNIIAEELARYRFEIAALQEVRWKGQGQIDKKNYSFFYSGPEIRQGNHGVGFIVKGVMHRDKNLAKREHDLNV